MDSTTGQAIHAESTKEKNCVDAEINKRLRKPMVSLPFVSSGSLHIGTEYPEGTIVHPFSSSSIESMDIETLRSLGKEYRVFSDMDGVEEFSRYAGDIPVSREEWIKRLNEPPTTTSQVNVCLIKPDTLEAKCSYAEMVARRNNCADVSGEEDDGYVPAVGVPTTFLSHAWRYPFSTLLHTVQDHFKDIEERRRIFIWNDIFVEDQNATERKPKDYFFSSFSKAVGTIGSTLLVLHPWDSPIPLQRSWCIWELYSTVCSDATLDIALPPSSVRAFRQTLLRNFDTIAKNLCAIDASEAQALYASTKHRIDDTIRGTCGFKEINKKVGKCMREWLCRVGKSLLREEERIRGICEVSSDTLIISVAKLLFDLDDHNSNEAEVLLRRALAAREKRFGKSHAESIHVVEILGKLLNRSGRLDDAEPLLRRALDFCKKSLGDRHKMTLHAANGLARLLRYRGKFEQAERMMRETVTSSISVLGWENDQTLETANNLGRLLRYVGRPCEAEALIRRVVRTRTALLGKRHNHTLCSINNLAGALAERKKFVESEALYLAAISGFEQTIGPLHRNTLNARGNLGLVRMRIRGKEATGEHAVRGVLRSLRGSPYFYTDSSSWIRKFKRALDVGAVDEGSEVTSPALKEATSPMSPPTPLLAIKSSTVTVSSVGSRNSEGPGILAAVSALRKGAEG